jgi:hypothetical protein
VKKDTDSTSNLIGAGELKEAGGKEQEGTSHAQDQAAQERSVGVVPLSATSPLPCTGNEAMEAHPPIRKVRGLTPPRDEANEDDFPLMDAEDDKELERVLAQNRRTRKQLKEENVTLTDTVKALKQHIVSQAKCKEMDDYEKSRLRDQCRYFAAVLRQIPSTIVDENVISKTPFTQRTYEDAMYEHESVEVRMARGWTEVECQEESSDDEANQTPSPVEQGELLIEKTMEGSTEQVQELQPLQPQKEQQTLSSEDSEQKDKPPMSANPAKRILSNSDDSDAGNDKPDMQRLKSEHGAVTRTKTTRSNR